MPTIKISYEDIRQEAKELLSELKKTNPKAKLTQAQTLVANKYDCKNLAVLRNKTNKNNGFLEMDLTYKIVSESTDLIKQLFDVVSNDNGVPCVTVYVKGYKDTSGRTIRLDDKTIENILDNKNTILTLHHHFSIVIGADYLNLVCVLLNNKNNPMFDIDTYIFNENLIRIAKKYEREEAPFVLNFAKNSTDVDLNSLHYAEKTINEAINYAYEIGDKDECTDKHIAYVLSSLYLGGSSLQTIDYNTPNPNLEFDSKEIIKLYKLWDKVEMIVPKISKSLFKEIVSRNEYAFYFDEETINQTRDSINNDKRILKTILNISKNTENNKNIKVKMSDLMPKEKIAEEQLYKSLNQLKEETIVDSVSNDNNNISITISSKLKNFILKK